MSENLKKALELIQKANLLLKEEWDKNVDNHPDNHLTSGCYKALNAVTNALSAKVNVHEQDEDYVFGRLMESVARLADHYGVSFEEALSRSCSFTPDQIDLLIESIKN